MKKRLSLLMAALMIITMLPMSSFAAASVVNTTLDIMASAEDVAKEYKNVSVTFKIPKGSTITPGKLRLELDNGAEFRGKKNAGTNADELVSGTQILFANIADTAGKKIDSTTVTDNEVKNPVGNIIFIDVKSDKNPAPTNDNMGEAIVNTQAEGTLTVNLPIYFPNTGDVTLKLVDETNVGFGTLAPVKIAVVKDTVAGLSVTAKDSEKTVSFDGGKLSQFEIKNLAPVPSGATHLVISLDDEEHSFAADTELFVDGSKVADVPTKLDAYVVPVASVEKAKLVLGLPSIKKMGRKASEGEVKVYVQYAEIKNPDDAGGQKEEVNFKGSAVSAVIGKVVDYNVTMTVVEKGKKEMPSVWGGEKVMVTVTLKGPKGSILARPIDFKVDGANVTYKDNTNKATKPNSAKFDGKADGTLFKDAEFALDPLAGTEEEVKFDIELVTKADKDGVATITAAQRGWEVKADAVKITPKFAVKSEVMPVKKGEARPTANVVITEAKAGLLEKGEYIVLSILTRNDYTQFTKGSAVKVEATNGMTFGDPSIVKIMNYGTEKKVDNRSFVTLQIPIKKQSRGEAAVITVSGINVLIDGSATDDMIKLDARLSKKDDAPGAKVASVDYIKVVKEYAFESILTVFTIGQTQYTVNGEAKTAASAPYIKNGKTMLPIRALAESLGLKVQWNGATKTATFTDDSKVAAVTIGAEKLYVNGTPIPLAAKAELVNGTTFVELRSLATAFGVQIDWDAAAKTATVSK